MTCALMTCVCVRRAELRYALLRQSGSIKQSVCSPVGANDLRMCTPRRTTLRTTASVKQH
ncbi:hypothetical protein J6590_039370 [Homalodisca vitripennis]|nr:hypothetical protein J6590_039370 [Homalodisca vitripennis]